MTPKQNVLNDMLTEFMVYLGIKKIYNYILIII